MALRPFQFLKNYLPRGLYGRSLMIIVAPMVLLQAAVAYVFLERHWQMVTEKLSASVVSDIAFLLDEYEQNPTAERAGEISSRANSFLTLSVAFLPGEKLPEDHDGVGLLDRSLSSEIEHQIGRPHRIDTRQYSDYVDIRLETKEGVMRVLALRSRVYAANSHIFIVWMVGASIVLLIIAMIFLRNQIRPIVRLAEAAESFGRGRDVPSFRPQGATEVRRAAVAFIDMRMRIQRQIEQRTAMLAGVSHDLRTPLTRFKLQLAMLGSTPEIGEMKADIAEMEHMLEDYLNFARGDQGEVSQETDLTQLLEEIRNDQQRKGHDIVLDLHGELRLPLRRNAFKRCLTNVIDNACKYAKHIWVTALMDGEDIVIVVDDDGEGIPDDKLEEVFRPFFRLDAARNLDQGGSGLGLAIARDIAHGHGGDIHLSRSPKGGLRAVIHVPV
jgi:two-component system osmolarity sensor histidine kinase EnvZ